jgi:hypothetical protein
MLSAIVEPLPLGKTLANIENVMKIYEVFGNNFAKSRDH